MTQGVEQKAREMLASELDLGKEGPILAACLRAIIAALNTDGERIRREALEEALGGYASLEDFVSNLEYFAGLTNVLGEVTRQEFRTAAKVIRAISTPLSKEGDR